MRIDWSELAILDLEGINEFIQRDSEYLCSRIYK